MKQLFSKLVMILFVGLCGIGTVGIVGCGSGGPEPMIDANPEADLSEEEGYGEELEMEEEDEE